MDCETTPNIDNEEGPSSPYSRRKPGSIPGQGSPHDHARRLTEGKPLIDAKAGLVVSFDSDQLYQGLLSLLNNTLARFKYGEIGKLLATEKYDWKNIAIEIEGIYQLCIDH